MKTKVCSKCREEKSISSFDKRYDPRRSPEARYSQCRRCVYLRRKASGLEPERSRRRRLAIYGLTINDYDKMLLNQKNVCAICKTSQKELVVDHNHKTNSVRGLLCSTCNFGLGNFYDNTRLLESAQKYLEHYDNN